VVLILIVREVWSPYRYRSRLIGHVSGISASLRAYTSEFSILINIVRLYDRCFENTNWALHATDHAANNGSSSKRDELM